MLLAALFIAQLSLGQTEGRFVGCKQLTKLGLFEQCAEVRILEKMGKQTRVYSFASKEYLTLPAANVFEIQTSRQRKFYTGEKILVPGNKLWNSSPTSSFTLCEFKGRPLQSAVLTLECGESGARLVHESIIFQIERSAPILKSVQSKK